MGLLRTAGLLVALIASFCASTALGDDLPSTIPTTWQIYSDPGLRFRVSLPPGPRRSTSSRRTFVGEVMEFKIEGQYEGAEFLVQVRELPAAALWLTTDDYLFSEVKARFFMGGKRPRLIERPIVRDGHSGWLLRYEDPTRGDGDWVEDAEIFLLERHLYFVVVARKRPFEHESMIESFFKSFDMW